MSVTSSAILSTSMTITPITNSNIISMSIINRQSLIGKVFSRYLHSPGSHQSTLFLESLTDSLTDIITLRASCGAKNRLCKNSLIVISPFKKRTQWIHQNRDFNAFFNSINGSVVTNYIDSITFCLPKLTNIVRPFCSVMSRWMAAHTFYQFSCTIWRHVCQQSKL